MRIVLALACAWALAACGERAATNAEAGCNRSATHEVAWSTTGAPHVVTATSEGPTCRQAVVTLVIRNAAGDPLWAVAKSYEEIAVGGRSNPPVEVTTEAVDAFLASWADPTMGRTSALPPWTEGAERPGAPDDGMNYHTDYDRETYERFRALDLPQLCYAAHIESSTCLVIDPQTGDAFALVSFGA